MKTWNVAIVGAGSIADIHAKALRDMPNVRLVGICDPVAERADKLARDYACKAFHAHQDLFQDSEIDIVTIATPSGAHLDIAVAAAQAGIHAICEKPLEITTERIAAMIAAHQKAGTRLGCIFQNRFHPGMNPIRKAVKDQRFGTVTFAGAYVPWWRVDAYYQGSWHGTWKLDGGGALMNQAIHTIDLLCELFWPVEAVQAFTDHLGHPYIETEDTAAAVLRFRNGALGLIYGTTASFPGQNARLEITGTKGTAIVSDGKILTWQFAEERPEDEPIRQAALTDEGSGASDPAAIWYKGHVRNFQAFIQAVETGQPYMIEGPEAAKSVRLIQAIYDSAREQKLVRLDA